MTDSDKKVLSDIDEFGCHVISVFDPEDQLPPFTYSVGIQESSGEPEVVVFGLKNTLAQSVVDNYNRRIREGECFEPGRRYTDFLEGFEVYFEPVDRKHYKDHFGYDLWLYGDEEFAVLQLIWPTTSGAWPWEPEASEWFKVNQRLLGRVPFAVES